MEEVAQCTPSLLRSQAHFRTHGHLRQGTVRLGYHEVRLPDYPEQRSWLVVTRTSCLYEDWFLLTNVPVLSHQQATEIWRGYCQRWSIECWFRFLKEEGLHLEDIQVRRLEGISALG